jgi:hypothetical protein
MHGVAIWIDETGPRECPWVAGPTGVTLGLMTRCQRHLDWDRYVREAEQAVQVQGLPTNHPNVIKWLNRAKAVQAAMKHSGHSITPDCPDEE